MTLPACDRIIELSEKASVEMHGGMSLDEVLLIDRARLEFSAESRTLAPKIAAALNEAVRAIEEIAPHHEGCSAEFHHSHHLYGPCTCWKRAALARITELLKHP